ncbi:hypothetical protein AbraIFM66950_008249 [Aspergillus brasiliensis]|nr:hypothetical protein AbraIFM66950_008249 [Aspergillus brasiliensis]
MHPVIPPLQWGGFQPANYGALQILMVIQVISYLLTEVERALGVDEWERERSRSEERTSSFNPQMHGQPRRRDPEGDHAGAGGGLLSSAMIELVVQGEESGNNGHKGKIGVLRRELRRLKKELEKRMHI